MVRSSLTKIICFFSMATLYVLHYCYLLNKQSTACLPSTNVGTLTLTRGCADGIHCKAALAIMHIYMGIVSAKRDLMHVFLIQDFIFV